MLNLRGIRCYKHSTWHGIDFIFVLLGCMMWGGGFLVRLFMEGNVGTFSTRVIYSSYIDIVMMNLNGCGKLRTNVFECDY